MTVFLKITAFINDVPCLNAGFGDPRAPSRQYGLVDKFGAPLSAGAIYRRHCVFPYQAMLSAHGYEQLLADLAVHEEAQLLLLTPGEFFGLQIGVWRVRHDIAFEMTAPMPYWMQLIGFAQYKAERAKRKGHRDVAAALLKSSATLRARYEAAREHHNARLMRPTLH